MNTICACCHKDVDETLVQDCPICGEVDLCPNCIAPCEHECGDSDECDTSRPGMFD